MKRRLWRVTLLISAAGLSACAAVSSGFVYPDETGFLKAEPSRVVYSIKSEFVKERDLRVYLYRADGGLSRIPIQDVITSIRGQRLDSYIFGENDPGVWEIGVGYADMEPTTYMITVLSAE